MRWDIGACIQAPKRSIQGHECYRGRNSKVGFRQNLECWSQLTPENRLTPFPSPGVRPHPSPPERRIQTPEQELRSTPRVLVQQAPIANQRKQECWIWGPQVVVSSPPNQSLGCSSQAVLRTPTLSLRTPNYWSPGAPKHVLGSPK